MKYFSLFFLIIAIIFTGNSQISDSLFSTYKNQDLKLRTLDFSGSLSGNNNISNSDFYYNGNGALNFSQFTNQNKSQSDFSSRLLLRHSKNRDNYSYNPLNSQSTIDLAAYNKSRFYPGIKLFYGYGYNFSYNFTHSNREDFSNSIEKDKSKQHRVNIEIPLSIGTGRKYPVYSVHKSMWIYSELKKNHSTKRDYNEGDVEQLSNLLDDNFYTRYFDYRYKSIQDLSRVDSLLKKQDIIASHDINYFTTLYDMYYYSSGLNRFRGGTLEGGITGQFLYNNYHQSTTIDTSVTSYDINNKLLIPVLFVEFQNFKPINLFWQFDYLIRAEFGFKSFIKDNNNSTSQSITRRSVEGKAILTFYPNTRSRLSAGLVVQYGNKYSNFTSIYSIVNSNDYSTFYLLNSFPMYGLITSNQNEFWDTRLELIHYYYISPQFRVQTNFSLSYSDNDYITNSFNHKLIANFGISFSYAIF